MRNKIFVLFTIGILIGTTIYSSFAAAQIYQPYQQTASNYRYSDSYNYQNYGSNYNNQYGSTAFGGSSYSGAYSTRYQPQPSFQTYYSSEQIDNYWPILGNKETCRARSDLMINVAPFGCQPAVVRSDLLGEQNVPVFCQLDAVNINPLIDINQIRNIRFTGQYPPEISGFGFHPARAALRTHNQLLGSPLLNNIGYVVVILKKQPDESKLPKSISVNLTAQIEYNAENAFGIGRTEFVLERETESDWEKEKAGQSFWRGRYFLRLDDADPNYATVSVYEGDRRVNSMRVGRGQTSQEIYVPGMYCQAGLQVSYDGLIAADKKARIEVSSDQGADVFDVYEGSRFLEDRCAVRTIEIYNDTTDTGRVFGNCQGRSFVLELKPRFSGMYEELVINGKIVQPLRLSDDEYEVNLESHNIVSRRGIYLVDKENAFSRKSGTRAGEYVSLIYANGSFNFGTRVIPEDMAWMYKLRDSLIKYKEKIENGSTSEIASAQISADAMKYFDEAIENYERIAEDYPQEPSAKEVASEKYGGEALQRGIELAKKFGRDDVRERLINKLLDIYPNSDLSSQYIKELNDLYKLDAGAAVAGIEIDNLFRTIRLVGVSEPNEKASADFIVENRRATLKRGETRELSDGNRQFGEIRLEIVEPERVTVSAYCMETERYGGQGLSTYRRRYDLRTDGYSQEICGLNVRLDRTNVRDAAKIRLTPVSRGTQTTANFTVNIGIEKRLIKLSPDKAREKIENLNKTIKKWEDIANKLGNVVSGLKTACFATAAFLTFKNFVTGLSGETVARQEIMGGENGWRNKCRELVDVKKEYPTLDACYLGKAGEIERDVSAMKNALNKVNAKIQSIQSGFTTNTDIFGQSVDSDKVKAALAEELKKEYGSMEIDISKLRKQWLDESGNPVNKTIVNMNELLSKKNIDNNLVTTADIKSLMLYSELRNTNSGTLKENLNSKFTNIAERINENQRIRSQVESAKKETAEGLPMLMFASAKGQGTKLADIVPVGTKGKLAQLEGKIKYAARVHVPGSSTDDEGNKASFETGNYILGLEEVDSRSGIYGITKIFEEKDGKYVEINDSARRQEFTKLYGLGNIKASDRESYNHQIVEVDRKVKYYENEPYKGMPAIVPFDVREGWYAATKQTLPMFGGIGAFDASGRVTSFWLCNVGDNGRIEFETGLGDDICEQVNLNTGQPLGAFPGLSESKAKALVTRAIRAIEDAARQYGNKYVTIAGERFEVGNPSIGQPETQCQDFMSPQDCLLMFNVCDPVVCPSSRCNLGGQFPVANVAQTGIIGSILLCLPNIREGIVIPVCLTGIKAGIDGWVSILRNYRDCLQENIDSGRTVGLCDELHSIYMCDFFWGQIAPFVAVLIPKIIEMAYGQGVRGGAEYLTVNAAWQNMEKSINYFTNSYAVNSMTAFQARTTGQYSLGSMQTGGIAEIGTQFCKSFISMKAPTAFKTLVEPDSPPQFHAYFDQKRYSDATVPATSQYKVFYHIFAGKDAGVSYMVYLRNPPQSSYYATASRVTVASGFVPRGEYASETKDFTAPEGYKELCVRINADEQCGFGQVSTSFAVNYIRDLYVKSEIDNKNIASEKECIGGSNNLGALANPNIQAGVEDVVSPNIYNRGVVRICSTNNPGATTDPTRYINVGYCDDPKIGCWLDKRSVDNALTSSNIGLKNETLQNLEKTAQEYLEESGELMREDEAAAEIYSLEEALRDLEKSANKAEDAKNIIDRVDFVFDKVTFYYLKAKLLLIRGQANGIVAEELLGRDFARMNQERVQNTQEAGTGSAGRGAGQEVNLDLGAGEWFYLNVGQGAQFSVLEKQHLITLGSIQDNKTVLFYVDSERLLLYLDDPRIITLNDGTAIEARVGDIDAAGNTANVFLSKRGESAQEEEQKEQTNSEAQTTNGQQENEGTSLGNLENCEFSNLRWEDSGEEISTIEIGKPTKMVFEANKNCLGGKVYFIIKKDVFLWGDSELFRENEDAPKNITKEGRIEFEKIFGQEVIAGNNYYFVPVLVKTGSTEEKGESPRIKIMEVSRQTETTQQEGKVYFRLEKIDDTSIRKVYAGDKYTKIFIRLTREDEAGFIVVETETSGQNTTVSSFTAPSTRFRINMTKAGDIPDETASYLNNLQGRTYTELKSGEIEASESVAS